MKRHAGTEGSAPGGLRDAPRGRLNCRPVSKSPPASRRRPGASAPRRRRLRPAATEARVTRPWCLARARNGHKPHTCSHLNTTQITQLADPLTSHVGEDIALTSIYKHGNIGLLEETLNCRGKKTTVAEVVTLRATDNTDKGILAMYLSPSQVS